MDRRKLDYKDFDELANDVKQLHDYGYDKAGQWDLSQTCEHLNFAMNQSLDGYTFKGPWFLRKILVPLFVKRSFYKSRKIQAGLPAPGGSVFDSTDESQAVQAFLNTVQRVKQTQQWPYLHPIFEKLTDDQWRQFHLIHAAHHFSFLYRRSSRPTRVEQRA